ncbi:Crp/Fnr family transcriptional regulator [Bradyrhizobium septentrionale]|uniref:Crp/Fnr family transcriptional regulator n=1 Tax=Bradyrhizobium septentrionale TaxID=1404411 RepID=A0A973VZX9_9BRAD|nr:Crp/Fnr family transcriptional regulator [Bradyrhizobium septentrionale]UGY13721.1 Crp/Fnr family transcriptional regulator [Bradyrhizobium septentrionale]
MTTERDEADEVRTFIKSLKSKRIGHARKGTKIIESGKRISEIILVSRGQLRIDMVRAQCRTAMVGLIGPDSWLSEGAVDGAEVHSTTATAVTESDYIAFPRATFPTLLEENQPFNRFFTRGAAKTTRSLNEAMRNLLNSAHLRIATNFYDRFAGTNEQELLIDATPKHYAEMVGIARGTAHRVINNFRDAGLLTKRDHDYLLNRAALEEYLQWERTTPPFSTGHEFAHFVAWRKGK